MTKKLFWGLAIVFWVAAAVGHSATTANLLINPGAETGDLTGWNIGFATPRVDDGTFNSSVQPRTGKFAFLGGEGEYASLWQRVNLPASGVTTAQIDSGNFYAQIGFSAQGLDQSDPSDSSRLALVFRDADGVALSAAASPLIDSHLQTWSNFTASLKIPAGARAIDYVMEFVRNKGSDLDAYFDDNSLLLTDTPTAPPFPTPVITLPATLRDFHSGGDFEGSVSGLTQDLVSTQLDATGKPHFIAASGKGDISSATSFEQFFNDVPEVNVKTNFVIVLTPSPDEPGVFIYQRNDFFPIDHQLLGDEDLDHNFHFTIEAHSTFTFHGGEFIDITADDDAWLYINGKLVIDLGGTHSAENGRVELNTLGLVPGQNYAFDFFYAERHTGSSTLILKTSAKLGGASTGPLSDSNWRAKNVVLYDSVEAECLVRVGDIDYLGFGWPLDYDIFSGKTAPTHDYPWEPDPTDPPGTDRIQVISSFKGDAPNGADGYTSDTSRPANTPQPITMDFTFNGTIHAAVLQMFVDDFQAPIFGSRYQVKLNGIRAPFLEEVINALDQTGPVGKLISVPLPSAYLELLAKGRLVISIDDFETGAGDGFAIDFARLLINPKTPQKLGAINGTILDDAGEPVTGALIVAGEQEAISDDSGNFSFTNIIPGAQHLTVRKEGFITAETSVDVAAGQIAEPTISLTEFIDSDGDGLSDSDEINIYHTDPNKADTDGDGMNDGAEITAGTNPNSINASLRFTAIGAQSTEGSIDLAFEGIANHVYQLQRYIGDDLRRANDPAWIEVDTIVSQGGAEVFHAPTAGSQQGYFRIIEAAAAATADPTAPILEPPTAWPSTATAAGSLTLRVAATDNVGVTAVTFFDGPRSLGAATRISANVWQLAWPITATENGIHTISAQARDAAGNSATSASLNFPVNIQTGRQTIIVGGVTISADLIVTNNLTVHISGNIRVADFAFTAETQITVNLDTSSITVHGQVDLPGLELPGPVDFTITRAEGGASLNYTALQWLDFQLQQVRLKLTHDSKGAASVDANARVQFAALAGLIFSGKLNLDAGPELRAMLDHDIAVGVEYITGMKQGASVALSKGKITVAGELFGGLIQTLGASSISGSANFDSAGNVTLSGSVNLPPIQSGAFTLRARNGGALTATLNPTGLTIAAGAQIDYNGASLGNFSLPAITLSANGNFTVHVNSRPAAPVASSLLGFVISNTSFTFQRDENGMGISSFSGSMRLPSRLGSRTVAVTGSLPNNGKFSLTGSTTADVYFSGFTSDTLATGASATLSQSGLKLHGTISGGLFNALNLQPLALDISVTPAGVLTYTSSLNIPGLDFGQIKLRPSGSESSIALKLQSDKLLIQSRAKLLYGAAALGSFTLPTFEMDADGNFELAMHTTGTALTGSLAGFALQELEFTLRRSGGVVSLDDFGATIAPGGLASPVSFRVSGSLASDGHYSLNGTTTVALNFNNLPVNTMSSGALVTFTDGALGASGSLLGGIVSSLNLPPITGSANFSASGAVTLGGTVSVPPLVFGSIKLQPPGGGNFTATLSSTALTIPSGAEVWYRLTKLANATLPGFPISANGDFSVSLSAATGSGSLRGINLLKVGLTVTRGNGATSIPSFQADLDNPLLKQHISGSLQSDGTYSATYNGTVAVGPYSLANATVSLSQFGLEVSGSPTITGMPFTLTLAGEVQPDGSFSLSQGFSTKDFYGFPMKGVSIVLAGDTTTTTLTASMKLNFPNAPVSTFNSVPLSGTIALDGSFTIHPSQLFSASLLGYALSNADLQLKRGSGSAASTILTAATDLSVAGLNKRLAGQIDTAGAFDLVYAGLFGLGGFNTLDDIANSIHLTSAGVTAYGKFDLTAFVNGNAIHFGTINFNGAINSDGTHALLGSGQLNFGPFTTDTFELALTQAGVYLGTTGNRNVNFGNLKLPFNIFSLTSSGLTAFSSSVSGDSGWRRFPSGTPFNGSFNSGDIFGRFTWNLGASASADGNIQASIGGTFGAWTAFVNPPPNDINQSDFHTTVGPLNISSNGAINLLQTYKDQTSFLFTLW